MSKCPFPLRELLKRLKPYGIEALFKRGKGSEIILLKPNQPGSRQGPQYPIKNHGPSTEISIPVIKALLRRFEILEDDFWD
jgi:hypothetical protein